MLNGRFSNELNNYTYITGNGKSVVDYVLTRQCDITNCIQFEVLPIKDLVTGLGLYDTIGKRCKLPDHSTIQCILKYTPVQFDSYTTPRCT